MKHWTEHLTSNTIKHNSDRDECVAKGEEHYARLHRHLEEIELSRFNTGLDWRSWIEHVQHFVRFKKMESKFTKINECWPAPACPSPSRPPSYLKAQPSLWALSVKFSINPASCSSVHHLSPYFTCLKPKKILCLTHFQEQVVWGNWLPSKIKHHWGVSCSPLSS